jgi:hypothetical protein
MLLAQPPPYAVTLAFQQVSLTANGLEANKNTSNAASAAEDQHHGHRRREII